MHKILNNFDEFVKENYTKENYTTNYVSIGQRQGVVDWEDQNRKTSQHVGKDIHDIRKNVSTKFKIDSNDITFDGSKIFIDSELSITNFNLIKNYIKKTFDKDCLKKSKG